VTPSYISLGILSFGSDMHKNKNLRFPDARRWKGDAYLWTGVAVVYGVRVLNSARNAVYLGEIE